MKQSKSLMECFVENMTTELMNKGMSEEQAHELMFKQVNDLVKDMGSKETN